MTLTGCTRHAVPVVASLWKMHFIVCVFLTLLVVVFPVKTEALWGYPSNTSTITPAPTPTMTGGTPSKTRTKTWSESLTASEGTVSQSASSDHTMTETVVVSPSDTLVKTMTDSQVLTLTASETTSLSTTESASPSDEMSSMTETMTKSETISGSLSDEASMSTTLSKASETLSFEVSMTTSEHDTLSMSPSSDVSASVSLSTTETVSESVSLETITASPGRLTLSPSEETSMSASSTFSSSETLSATDSATPSTSLSNSDTLTLSESPSVGTPSFTPSDGTPTSTHSASLSSTASLSTSSSLSESFSRSRSSSTSVSMSGGTNSQSGSVGTPSSSTSLPHTLSVSLSTSKNTASNTIGTPSTSNSVSHWTPSATRGTSSSSQSFSVGTPSSTTSHSASIGTKSTSMSLSPSSSIGTPSGSPSLSASFSRSLSSSVNTPSFTLSPSASFSLSKATVTPTHESTTTPSVGTPSKSSTVSPSRSVGTESPSTSVSGATKSASIGTPSESATRSGATSSPSASRSAGTPTRSLSPPPTPSPTFSSSMSASGGSVSPSHSPTTSHPLTISPSVEKTRTRTLSPTNTKTYTESMSSTSEVTATASTSSSETLTVSGESATTTFAVTVSGDSESFSTSSSATLTFSGTESASDERSSMTESNTFSATGSNGFHSLTMDTLTATVSSSITLTASESSSITFSASLSPTLTVSTSQSSTETMSGFTEEYTGSETLSLTESASSSRSTTETASESQSSTFTGSESTSASATFSSSLSSSETVSMSEGSETVTSSDRVSGSAIVTPSPLITLTDSVSMSPTHSRSPTQTETATESPSSSITPTTSPTPTLTLSESNTLSSSLSSSDTVTFSVSPSVTFTPSVSLTPTDTWTSSDSETLSDSSSVTLTNAVTATAGTQTLTASSSSSSSPSLSVSESVETQSSSASSEASKSVSTSQTLSESLSGTITGSDHVTVTNRITPSPTLSETPSTTVSHSSTGSMSESLLISATPTGPTPTFSTTPTESLSISMSVSESASTSLTVTDSPSYTPTESVSDSMTVTGSEVTFTASGGTETFPTPSPSASATPTQTLTRSQGHALGTFTITETFTHSPTASHPLTETKGLTLTKSLVPTITTSLSDPTHVITISESITRSASLVLTLTVTPVLSTTLTRTRSVTETNTLEITATSPNTETRSVPDTATLTHSPSHSDTPTTTESESFSSLLTLSEGSSSMTETRSGSTSTTQTISVAPTASESLAATDTASSTIPVTTTHTLPSMTTTMAITASPSGSESETLSESPTVTFSQSVSSSDATATLVDSDTLSQSPTATFSFGQTLTQGLTQTMNLTLSLAATPSDEPVATMTQSSSFTSVTVTGSPSEDPTASLSGGMTTSPLPSGTFSLEATLTLELPPTRTMTPSPTHSRTRTLSETFTYSATTSATGSAATASSSLITTGTATITPPPTPTKSASVTFTHSPPPTLTPSVSTSLSESGGSMSMTAEATASITVSSSLSSSQSTTISFSVSDSFSSTWQLFTDASHYITNPRSPFDVLYVQAKQIIRFMDAPQYRQGDRAGVVPQGVPCTVLNKDGQAESHPSMTAMQYRGPHIPSNWTVEVQHIGYYRVCYYMSFPVERWFDVQPNRLLAFGTRLLHRAVSPRVGLVTSDKVTFKVPAVGGSGGDVIHLVPVGIPCAAVVPTAVYLPVSSVEEENVQVEGKITIAGDYRVCYRGWPHSKRPSEMIEEQLHFDGIIDRFDVFTPSPLRETQQLNMTVFGAGITISDTMYLSSSENCFTNGTVIDPRVGDAPPARRGLSALNLVFTLTFSGDLFFCHRSNVSNALEAMRVGNPIKVERIAVKSVVPANKTYAVNSHVELQFIGDLLDPAFDRAQLHFETHCADPNPVPMTYDVDASVWVGQVPKVGEYSICYGTNTSLMHLVDGYGVFVVRRFYKEPAGFDRFFYGIPLNEAFVLDIEGYGLTPSQATTWLQYASVPCALSPAAPAIMATSTTGARVTYPVTLGGVLQICYITQRGGILSSADFLPVQPEPPTGISPIVGGVEQDIEITLLGGAGWSLTRDRVVLCENNTALLPFSSTTFRFNPPSVGQYEICFITGATIHDGQTNTKTPITQAFSAVPIITSAQVAPQVAPVDTAITIDLELFGFNDGDRVEACTPAGIILNNTATFERNSPKQWTATFGSTGNFSLCFITGSIPHAAPTVLPTYVIAEPKVGRLEPNRVYSGDLTTVVYSGLNVSGVTGIFRAGSSGDCTTKGAALPLIAEQRTISVQFVERGQYQLCYTGLTTQGFPIAHNVQVVPKVQNMSIDAPLDTYSGCPTGVTIEGSGVNSTSDIFFLAASSSCIDNVASVSINNADSTHKKLVGSVILPQASTTYHLCFAPEGKVAEAESFGTAFAKTAFDFISGSQYTIRYRCSFPAGSTFTFSAKTNTASEWMQLDEPLSKSEITVGHLPYGLPTIRIVANPSSLSSETVLNIKGRNVCENVPSAFTGSKFRRFSQAYFVMLNFNNYKNSSCTANPSDALDAALTTLGEDKALLVDPIQMLPVFSETVKSVPNGVQIGPTVLAATVPNIAPYETQTEPVLDAHLDVAADMLSVAAQASGTAAEKQKIVEDSINRITAVATSMCASGFHQTKDKTAFSLSVKKIPGDNAMLKAGASDITVSMTFPSNNGYCFTAFTFPENVLPQSGLPVGRIRRHGFDTLATAENSAVETPNEFNLPLFAVAGDPHTQAQPAPVIADVIITYRYPQSMQPAVPSQLRDFIYTYGNSRWTHDPTAVSTLDQPNRIIKINVSSLTTNEVFVSGAISFTPIAEDASAPLEIDWTVVILSSAIIMLSVVAVVAGFCLDKKIDERHPPQPERHTVELLSKNLAGHRYVVAATRTPHHLISSSNRLAHIALYWAAAFGAALAIARSEEQPRSAALGSITGLLACVMATPVATIGRFFLFAHSEDKPSLIGAAVAVVAMSTLTPLTSFIIGVSAGAGAGLVAFGASAFVMRKTWSKDLDAQTRVGSRLPGWVLFTLFLMAVATIGVLFGFITLLPSDARSSYLVLSGFAWALVLDAAFAEPLCAAAWIHLAKKVGPTASATSAVPRNQPPLKALPYEVDVHSQEFDSPVHRGQRRFEGYDDFGDETTDHGEISEVEIISTSDFTDELAETASVMPSEALSEAAFSFTDAPTEVDVQSMEEIDSDGFQSLSDSSINDPFGVELEELDSPQNDSMFSPEENRYPNARSRSNAGGEGPYHTAHVSAGENDPHQTNPLDTLPRSRRRVVDPWY